MNRKFIKEIIKREYRIFAKGHQFIIVLAFSVAVAVLLFTSIVTLSKDVIDLLFSQFEIGYYFLTSYAIILFGVITIFNSATGFSREHEHNMHQVLYILPIDTSSVIIGKALAIWSCTILTTSIPYFTIIITLIAFLGLQVSIWIVIELYAIFAFSMILLSSYSMIASIVSKSNGVSFSISLMTLIGAIMLKENRVLKYPSPFGFFDYLTYGVVIHELDPIAVFIFLFACAMGIMSSLAMSWFLFERRAAYMF